MVYDYYWSKNSDLYTAGGIYTGSHPADERSDETVAVEEEEEEAFIALAMILLTMVITGKKEYMDVVIVMSLIVFMATVGISKYITKGGGNG